MFGYSTRRVVTYAAGVIPVALAAPLQANVNLEWRPLHQTALIGDVVEIGLYAVSDDETNQAFSVVEAVLLWDPVSLRLNGHNDSEVPYLWQYSAFFDDSAWDWLNEPCEGPPACVPDNDGDAWYAAWPQLFEDPPEAPPEGVLITSFPFVVLSQGLTRVELPAAYGDSSYTGVQDPDSPGGFITGTLGPDAEVIGMEAVPTVSEWGIGVMAAMTFIVGMIAFRHRSGDEAQRVFK